MLNMNVNINECTEVILNYSKDILDWLEEHKEKDISKDMVKQNLKELIDSSIEYSDVLCKDYIINGFDIQAAVNQKCMSLIITELYMAKAIDEEICIKLLNSIINDTASQKSIIENAIILVDKIISVSYKVIGINRFSNKLYLQHIKTSEYIELSGIMRLRQFMEFIILSVCKIKKEDMYITNSYNGNWIVQSNLIKPDSIYDMDYGKIFSILKDKDYSNIINYTKNKKNLMISIFNSWKDIDRLNSPNAVIYITDSTESAKKIQNLIGRECTILNTFGVKEDELPDIIFDDIVVIDFFKFTTDQIKERTYNSIPCSYIHEDAEIEGKLE